MIRSRWMMEFKVKYSDFDSYGVVHNSNYIAWLEDSLYSEICKNGILNAEIVITKIRCRYLYSVKYDSEVYVKSKITEIEGNRYSFRQELIDKSTEQIMVKSSGEYIIKETYESISSQWKCKKEKKQVL